MFHVLMTFACSWLLGKSLKGVESGICGNNVSEREGEVSMRAAGGLSLRQDMSFCDWGGKKW